MAGDIADTAEPKVAVGRGEGKAAKGGGKGKKRKEGGAESGAATPPGSKDLSKAMLMVKVLEGGVCLGTTDIEVGMLLKPGKDANKSKLADSRRLPTNW